MKNKLDKNTKVVGYTDLFTVGRERDETKTNEFPSRIEKQTKSSMREAALFPQ